MEGELCLQKVLGVMRRMLLCMQEAVEGELCFVLEVTRCVLFCILEAVDDALCLP